ncbi:RNA polymerase sigma factor [Goodfellowiella coeruleoviolacea]|uniref:RNA polymerase sigma-70 factor, sigma-E family n=1 Tax=Goodfellowiella coeruleoviolacea TaxID=334858 RepID=A0AAE3GF25_9PSEU|nr:SigE family RNA polymerase sigma factor [Goodfellowiella coeruleoviolacea]MCP2166167.1 RNA polymerase sigma-70 factor, sigma-E family [Goodfellowiella coeruleoviolacea]
MRRTDADEFRRFTLANAAALRRSAYLLCGDWHLAEDLMQATLVKVYQAWSRITEPELARSYVRTVLLRTWLDEKRRPWRRSERRDGELPDVADADADPQQDAQRGWRRDLVRRALLSLPPGQRAVLVLRYYDELSVAETAAALGCAEGTVKSQSAKGLARLRAHIARLDASAVLEGVPW